jgi:hypothetical protein
MRCHTVGRSNNDGVVIWFTALETSERIADLEIRHVRIPLPTLVPNFCFAENLRRSFLKHGPFCLQDFPDGTVPYIYASVIPVQVS